MAEKEEFIRVGTTLYNIPPTSTTTTVSATTRPSGGLDATTR